MRPIETVSFLVSLVQLFPSILQRTCLGACSDEMLHGFCFDGLTHAASFQELHISEATRLFPVLKTLPCVVVLVLASCRAETQDQALEYSAQPSFPSQSQEQISRSTNGKTVLATSCNSKQQNNGCSIPSLSLRKRAVMGS